MTVRMTKKLQKSLGIKEIPSEANSDALRFLDEWYMNIFNIGKNWFFIFMESTTFFTIVRPYNVINGSMEFIKYFSEMIKDSFNKENSKYHFKDFQINDMHLRNTENNAARRIIIDTVYHAEIKKYKKGDISIFDELNEIPQALLKFRNPREAYRSSLEEMINNESEIININ